MPRRDAAHSRSDSGTSARGGAAVTTESQVLTTLPVLPVKNTVLFPYLFLPLSVGRPTSVAAVEAALAAEEKTLLVVAQRDVGNDQLTQENLYPVGKIGRAHV